MGRMHYQVSYTMVRPVTLKFKLTLLHFSAALGGALGIEQPYGTILTFLVLKSAWRQILGDTVQCEKWWLVHFTLVHNFNTTRAVKKQTLTALFVWLQVPNYICKHRVHGSWKKPKMHDMMADTISGQSSSRSLHCVTVAWNEPTFCVRYWKKACMSYDSFHSDYMQIDTVCSKLQPSVHMLTQKHFRHTNKENSRLLEEETPLAWRNEEVKVQIVMFS